MTRLRVLLGLFSLVIVVAIVLVVVNIPALARELVTRTLGDYGIELQDLQGLNFNAASATADGFIIVANDLSVRGANLRADYKFWELLRGNLQTLSVDSLEVTLLPGEDSSTEEIDSTTVLEVIDVASQLPLQQIAIGNYQIIAENDSYHGSIQASPPDREITGSISASLQPEFGSEFTVELDDSQRPKITLEAYRNGLVLAQGTAVLTLEDDRLTLAANVSMQPEALTNLNTPLVLPSEQLEVTAEATSDWNFSRFTLAALTVDNATNELAMQVAAGEINTEIYLHTPLALSAEFDTAADLYTATVQSGQATVIVSHPDFVAQVPLRTGSSRVRCDDRLNCSTSLSVHVDDASTSAGDFALQNIQLRGDIEVNLRNGALSLSAPEILLDIPSNALPRETTVDFELSGRLSNMVLETDSPMLRFNLTTNTATVTVEDLEPFRPIIDGEFRLQNQQISGSFYLGLIDERLAQVSLNHDLTTNSGSAALHVPEYVIEQRTPPSQLLQQPTLNGELVAGSFSGTGDMSWERNAEGMWNAGGGIALLLDDIGGHFQDSMFIGLNTQIDAEITTPLGLRSKQPLHASATTVDMGLPLETMSWQYDFDSLQRVFRVQQLRTNVLGGSVEIPDFVFDLDREEVTLDLVISSLDLESVVALAEYPDLAVDGRVSGYLPILIRDGTVLIEEGLLSALKPGGSIRYTPANPIPSSSPNLQLVNEALSNYQYQILDSYVQYAENGDLTLEVQLRGSNPDMNSGQQINLNVNIVDNIPTLLRSLRASRVITEALEERLAER